MTRNSRRARCVELPRYSDSSHLLSRQLGETAPEVVVGEVSDARTRLSTPPLPSDIDSTPFGDLDHVVQLQAIRPHLEKVIREEYPPAQQRIDRFWYKGKARTFVQWHGNLAAYTIDEIILPELTRWACRPPLHSNGDANGDASDTVRPARPVGSERFEALDDDEREFVSVTPNAMRVIGQILISCSSSSFKRSWSTKQSSTSASRARSWKSGTWSR
jgi:hypothetical protein